MSFAAVDCPDPPEVIANGVLETVSNNTYYFGDIPQYNCSPGYIQEEGYKCGAVLQTGQWEGTPKCQCELLCFSYL